MISIESVFSISFSAIALALSAYTFWRTELHRGHLLLGRPQQFYLGADGGGRGPPKVYLKALIYSTSRNGHIVENLFVRVVKRDATQTFPIWVYETERMNRNGGLFVPREGIVASHHFILSDDAAPFAFDHGEIKLEIFGSIVGRQRPIRLHCASLEISEVEAENMKDGTGGLYFDWGPESGSYTKKQKGPNSKQPTTRAAE